jgi:serine/threonine-protein kinase
MPDVHELLQQGKYAEAAAELRRLGQLDEAQKLYERLWDWRAAAEVAQERGDRPALLRFLLEAKDPVAAARVGQALLAGVGGPPGTPTELTRAAEVYERHRMWGEAATVREGLGQLVEALALYKKAQLPLEAARVEETLGRLREAGATLERFLAEEPDAPEAPRAHLELGRLLAGFGKHEEAARHLQRAIRAADAALAPSAETTEPAKPPPRTTPSALRTALARARAAATTPPPSAKSAPASDDGEATAARRAAREALLDVVDRARRLLVVELALLGFRDGASSVLDALRERHPSLPPLDAYLDGERRAAAAQSGGRLGGRYAVVRLLGSGGMGRVYLARDALTGRDVAVKVVAAPADPRLATGYQRFLREARVVSSLQHPNIVGTVAFHEELGLLAMELMSGGTLAERLPGPLTPGQVRQLMLQILAGLEAAHAHGVVHRDIKPANIFFSSSGEAKLGDFGVAHLQDLGATQTAGFIGTLAYMAPEQITGAPIGFAADLYALGVTAFQALVGRLPFLGPDFVAQHLGETPPRPSSLRAALDRAWDAILLRMLEKDPASRHPTIEALRNELLAVPLELSDARTPSATPSGTPPSESAPPAGPPQRYAIAGVVAETPRSIVRQATDLTLGREVLLEDFPPGFFATEAGQAHRRWLRAIARHGGPHIQRVLGWLRLEDGTERVVFEAPVGTPRGLANLDRALRDAVASGLATLHDAGAPHGALADGEPILVTDHGPVLLVAGRAPLVELEAERAQLSG